MTEIRTDRDATKKIEISLTVNSKQPPTLFVRTRSDNENEPRHNYVNLTHEENDKSENEKSSNFEQFSYFLETADIVDFIGIGVENDHLEINSFSIEI